MIACFLRRKMAVFVAGVRSVRGKSPGILLISVRSPYHVLIFIRMTPPTISATPTHFSHENGIFSAPSQPNTSISAATVNIREMPDTGAEVVTVYKRNTLIEIVEFCAGWLKIKCPEAVSGLAYVLNSADTYAFTASKIYTVVPGDNLWKIAEMELGSGSRCADIRVLNGLTSNAIRVGMKLLIP